MLRCGEDNHHVHDMHDGYEVDMAPSSNVNYTDKEKPQEFIVHKPLSKKCSTDENELCSTKEDESECANNKQKDAKNEVAYNVMKYFNVSNVFECGRNNPDVSCERACMATEDN